MALDGKSFACATTEGVLVFSLDEEEKYAPYQLSAEVTLSSAIELHNRGDFIPALIVSNSLTLLGRLKAELQTARRLYLRQCTRLCELLIDTTRGGRDNSEKLPVRDGAFAVGSIGRTIGSEAEGGGEYTLAKVYIAITW